MSWLFLTPRRMPRCAQCHSGPPGAAVRADHQAPATAGRSARAVPPGPRGPGGAQCARATGLRARRGPLTPGALPPAQMWGPQCTSSAARAPWGRTGEAQRARARSTTGRSARAVPARGGGSRAGNQGPAGITKGVSYAKCKPDLVYYRRSLLNRVCTRCGFLRPPPTCAWESHVQLR